jgi:hypothetical protein
MIKKAIRRNKAKSTKVVSPEPIGTYGSWTVRAGQLMRSQGRPGTSQLFKAVAEKIPKDALKPVCEDLRKRLQSKFNGVYVAHDSMGYPRYIGRGNIRARLFSRFKKNAEELSYFSFYVVQEKIHEREIETLLIRALGSQLDFNAKKKRPGMLTGSVKDYEAGTIFYVRTSGKGKRSFGI